MLNHMKTTVEISDALLEQAKRASAERGTTLRELIEDGLRRLLAETQRPQSFKLRKSSFGGNGLRPEVEEGSWAAIRARAYEGRGG